MWKVIGKRVHRRTKLCTFFSSIFLSTLLIAVSTSLLCAFMEKTNCSQYKELASMIVESKSHGQSINITKVARHAGVHRQTLRKWVLKMEKEEMPTEGRPTLLTKVEEKALLSFIIARDAASEGIGDNELAHKRRMNEGLFLSSDLYSTNSTHTIDSGNKRSGERGPLCNEL